MSTQDPSYAQDPAAERAAVRVLRAVSGALIEEGSLERLCEKILDAAIDLLRADCASIQAFDAESGGLRLLGHRHLEPEAAIHWQYVRAGSGTSCGQALRRGERVVVPDLERDELIAGTDDQRYFRLCRIRAVQSTPLVSPSGELLGMLSTHWRSEHHPSEQELQLIDLLARNTADLIVRGRAEQSLKESEARFRLAAQAARFGVYSHDVRRNISWWSPELYAIVGIPPGTPITLETAQAFTHPEDRERLALTAREALDPAGSGELVQEFRIIRPDTGEMRWVYTRAQTLFEGEGPQRAATNHTGIMRDVTEQKLAEETLRQADRQKNEFLAMLSHELRNPLAAIRNAGEILTRLVGRTPDAGAPLAMLERQTSQLTRLVEDLLDVARISQGLIVLREEPLEIGEIIDQAIETVQPLVREKAHRLVVDKPFAPIHIRGDRARLVQCVGNILHNAAKYTDSGGSIEVRLHAVDAEVVLEVRDNGTGIAPELLPHIFDLFVQSERALDRARGGLGIGLSVVRHLIERHGGTVTAASEGVGRGSTFAIRLPRNEAPQARPAESAPSRVPRRRVLVVDDDADAADSMAMLLRLDGHEVEVAYSALAGLEAAERLVPEVILLDIGLPRMSGYEVARRLRASEALRDTRLVALSGYGRAEDRERARAAGFDDHLVKPADFAALESVLAAGPL